MAFFDADDLTGIWLDYGLRNWMAVVFLLLAIWYLGFNMLEWRFPVYLGGLSIVCYALSSLALRFFSEFWGRQTPENGVRLSSILERTKTLSLIGLLIADIATLATLVNEG